MDALTDLTIQHSCRGVFERATLVQRHHWFKLAYRQPMGNVAKHAHGVTVEHRVAFWQRHFTLVVLEEFALLSTMHILSHRCIVKLPLWNHSMARRIYGEPISVNLLMRPFTMRTPMDHTSFTAPVGIEAQIAIAAQDIRDQVIGH